jgi:hypothetical protein
MQTDIKISKSLTIRNSEEALRNIGNSEAIGYVDDILLPIDITKMAFGGLASSIQAINTWSKFTRTRRVNIGNSKSKKILTPKELIKKPHAFCAAMYAREIVSNNVSDENLKLSISIAARSAIEAQALSAHGQQHGSLCWFSFVDHSSKGFDRNFYIETDELKAEPRQFEQISAVIKSMIEKSLSVSGGTSPISSEQSDSIGRLFFELFLNTHEHGSRDADRKKWLKPAVRFIYTNGINLTKNDAEAMVKDEPALQNFLSVPDIAAERVKFIEISIIDAGLGYCGRWLADNPELAEGKNISLHDEYEIFKNCFKLRETSSGKANKGLGLPVVMDRLTQLNGLIKIRSGRLSLFRNFAVDPYFPGDNKEFSDWNTHLLATEQLTEMAAVSGVAVTILLPLEAK